MKQDRRRAIRTTVHTVGALVMLALLAWMIWRMPPTDLKILALGFVAILFVREMMHGAENVTARLKFNAGPTGVGGEITPGDMEQDQ